jgi:hypothetical protein
MSESLFEASFVDPAAFGRDWIVTPGMTLRNGVLAFGPAFDAGRCAAITRRNDFSDFAITADVRIVSGAAGLVLRAAAPDKCYMVQFDLANDPAVVWFHTFSPSAYDGYRLELVRTALVPKLAARYRMKVVVRGYAFDVFLAEFGGTLQHCASWQDREQTYRQGAVGVWAHGGEASEYRALRVEALPAADA